TGYGNTGLSPSAVQTQDDTHVAIYSRTSGAAGSAQTEIGTMLGTGSERLRFFICNAGGNFSSIQYGLNSLTTSNATTHGLFTATRRSSSDHQGYLNSTSIQQDTWPGSGGPITNINVPYFILAEN